MLSQSIQIFICMIKEVFICIEVSKNQCVLSSLSSGSSHSQIYTARKQIKSLDQGPFWVILLFFQNSITFLNILTAPNNIILCMTAVYVAKSSFSKHSSSFLIILQSSPTSPHLIVIIIAITAVTIIFIISFT